VKLKEKVKELVLEWSYRWIKVFRKKQSERMPIKNVRLYNKFEGRTCAKERKSISIVERRERRSMQVYIKTIEKRVY